MLQDGLLFDPGPNFPALWIFGLIGFLALWWYVVSSDSKTQRRTFLMLWVPAALAAALVYRLEVRGQPAADTLRLLLEGDGDTLRGLIKPPGDGYQATYGMVVGGAAAALAAMACQLAGILLGVILGISRPEGRHRGA